MVRAGIHPIKVPQGGPAPESLQRLKETIAVSPPPWLAKVMGEDPEERVRFSLEDSTDPKTEVDSISEKVGAKA